MAGALADHVSERATCPPGEGACDAEGLYARYSRLVYRHCLRELGSHEEAEDVLQETYLNACRSLSVGFRPHSPAAWLLKIAHNLCISHRRTASRPRPASLDVIAEVPGPPPRWNEELFALSEALAELPETQRRAFVLREWRGLGYDEIAKELGLSYSAVATHIFRGRRMLAETLDRARLRRVRDAGALCLAPLADWLRSVAIQGVVPKVATAIAVIAAGSLPSSSLDRWIGVHDHDGPHSTANVRLQQSARPAPGAFAGVDIAPETPVAPHARLPSKVPSRMETPHVVPPPASLQPPSGQGDAPPADTASASAADVTPSVSDAGWTRTTAWPSDTTPTDSSAAPTSPGTGNPVGAPGQDNAAPPGQTVATTAPHGNGAGGQGQGAANGNGPPAGGPPGQGTGQGDGPPGQGKGQGGGPPGQGNGQGGGPPGQADGRAAVGSAGLPRRL